MENQFFQHGPHARFFFRSLSHREAFAIVSTLSRNISRGDSPSYHLNPPIHIIVPATSPRTISPPFRSSLDAFSMTFYFVECDFFFSLHFISFSTLSFHVTETRLYSAERKCGQCASVCVSCEKVFPEETRARVGPIPWENDNILGLRLWRRQCSTDGFQ